MGNDKRFQILALDGGGIKGIFSAAVLAFLEDDLNIKITDHFDLIVGTSTGGIIALGLGIGMSPKEILGFYVEEGHRIFPKILFPALKHLFQAKHNPDNLEIALKKYFGERTLADSTKRLVIPSYNLGEDDVYLFKTPHHNRLRRDYKVPIWKVGMATSAAPTYFPSFRKLDHIRLVDGGVWANNPIMVGVVEAISLLGIPFENLRTLSLGTTNELKGRPINLNNGGLWQWRKSAVDVIMRGQSIGSYTQVLHLLGKDKVLRIDPPVPAGLFELDKLEEQALIAKAADRSRHFCPEFEERFPDHHANEYKPLYT